MITFKEGKLPNMTGTELQKKLRNAHCYLCRRYLGKTNRAPAYILAETHLIGESTMNGVYFGIHCRVFHAKIEDGELIIDRVNADGNIARWSRCSVESDTFVAIDTMVRCDTYLGLNLKDRFAGVLGVTPTGVGTCISFNNDELCIQGVYRVNSIVTLEEKPEKLDLYFGMRISNDAVKD